MEPISQTHPQRSSWHVIRRAAVATFVIWHLSFLLLSNISATVRQGAGDLGKVAALWIEGVERYESYTVLDQSWGMFTSPLWRTIPFPAGRVTLSDGSEVDVLSVNEPADMTQFFRFGGARLRKLEHFLVTRDLTGTYQEPMQRRYVESFAQRWRQMNPEDPRRPVAVTLLRRNFPAPRPGSAWEKSPTPEVLKVARYAVE